MIAIEEVDTLKKENLSLITVVTGEDLGQFSQLKERLMERVGYDKDDLTYSYFDMAEVDYEDAEMDLESLPFFENQKVVIFDNLLDITTSKKAYLDDKALKRFEAYLENPLETTRLIIYAPGKLDGKRRLVKILKRDSRIFQSCNFHVLLYEGYEQLHHCNQLNSSDFSYLFQRLLEDA